MTRTAIVRGLMLASVLVAWTGCKKDESSTTAAAAGGDPVQLLDAGAEPQTPLRYKIAEGTTTKSNMDFTMATLAKATEEVVLPLLPLLPHCSSHNQSSESTERLPYRIRLMTAMPG